MSDFLYITVVTVQRGCDVAGGIPVNKVINNFTLSHSAMTGVNFY